MRILALSCSPLERTRLRRLVAFAADGVARLSLAFADELDDDAMRGAPPFALLVGAGMAAHKVEVLLCRLGQEQLPVIFLGAGAGTTAGQRRRSGDHVSLALASATPASLHRALGLPCAGLPDRLFGKPPAEVVLGSIADAVITVDLRGTVCFMNEAAARMTGTAIGAGAGIPIVELMVLCEADSGAPISHPIVEVLASGRTVRLVEPTLLVRRNGSEIMIQDATSPILDADGAICGAVMVFHDVSETHQLRAQADYLAWHDFLTGLPNRFAAQRHLTVNTAQAQAHGLPLAVMYLDLDRFKAVNDTLGHAAGDALLVTVAARLRACFRPTDLVSRQGGDEFVVSMAPGSGIQDAAAAAERILAAVAVPYEIGGERINIGCSVGIAMFPEQGNNGETLLRHADMALHSAKAAGRNAWRLFRPELMASALRRREMENGMRDALDGARFELHYQPKIRLSDGALCGCEALLRWHDPRWGWVEPAEFIRYAEESGQIVGLGQWVLARAIRQAQQWERHDCCPAAIAINVSTIELMQPGFAEHLGACLGAAGLAPGRLQLELTESALMGDAATAGRLLHRLKELGVSLAIDDFGTGYSNLSYLADYPIDLLKMDRSFVHGVATASPRRQHLLRAVLALAGELSLPVVAEGIESLQEADFLADAGCLLGQGFYYGHALTPQQFEASFLNCAAGAH